MIKMKMFQVSSTPWPSGKLNTIPLWHSEYTKKNIIILNLYVSNDNNVSDDIEPKLTKLQGKIHKSNMPTGKFYHASLIN